VHLSGGALESSQDAQQTQQDDRLEAIAAFWIKTGGFGTCDIINKPISTIFSVVFLSYQGSNTKICDFDLDFSARKNKKAAGAHSDIRPNL
jgi:hypothetical protein